MQTRPVFLRVSKVSSAPCSPMYSQFSRVPSAQGIVKGEASYGFPSKAPSAVGPSYASIGAVAQPSRWARACTLNAATPAQGVTAP